MEAAWTCTPGHSQPPCLGPPRLCAQNALLASTSSLSSLGRLFLPLHTLCPANPRYFVSSSPSSRGHCSSRLGSFAVVAAQCVLTTVSPIFEICEIIAAEKTWPDCRPGRPPNTGRSFLTRRARPQPFGLRPSRLRPAPRLLLAAAPERPVYGRASRRWRGFKPSDLCVPRCLARSWPSRSSLVIG